jgi:hypothetical protein
MFYESPQTFSRKFPNGANLAKVWPTIGRELGTSPKVLLSRAF